MRDLDDKTTGAANVASQTSSGQGADAVADDRLEYEPPCITKRRGVARATLFTAMGPAMTGLTMNG